ncbi:MAG TPA: Holliday junction resolvase-like protein [Puia sp.]|nr:Holliday junction resolvase-like protein [Puia sp.]
MPSKTAHQDIIAALKKGNFFIECPDTRTDVSLKLATIFDRDNFSEEALAYYEEQLAFVKAEKLRLKKMKEAGAIKSEVGAQAINLGFILERLAPTLSSFPFSHHDCRSLFDPIDYVIFEGLSKNGRVDKIIFTDIKTGKARLKPRQREIRQVVEKKKITFKTY